jgi:hypothetical protein
MVRLLFGFILLLFSAINSSGQTSAEEIAFLSRMTAGAGLPAKLLDTRSAVFYSYTLTSVELDKIQQSCQRTGIDPIIYFETDELLAGKDVSVAMARYLNKRDITNLIFFLKNEKRYKAYITEYNTKETMVEQNQYAWIAEDPSLSELLLKIYRAAGGGMKRLNMLINDVPETDIEINPIDGRRSDFFAIDLKVDELAIPKTGDATMDKALEETFSAYPFKHKFTEPGLSEATLRKNGSLYVLCYIHTRGSVAKKLLGYDMSKSESAIASITYPDGGDAQLKNIPSQTPVYKFYFKHIDSGNVFLGTKWDADITWEQALKNQYRAFKAELKF